MTYETTATVTIAGNEVDVRVRCCVRVGRLMGGAWGAMPDGDPEVLHDGAWVDPDDVGIDGEDRERIVDAICEVANDDDHGADYRPRPFFCREGARYTDGGER
jgi:hypothetical protein